MLLALGIVLGVAVAACAALIWSTNGPPDLKLAAVLFLATLAVVATAAAAVAAAVTTARVDGANLRFAFGGIPVRTIPLAAVRGYQRLFGRGSVRIIYGSSWYCPNGLLDHDRLVDLLRAHGVAEAPEHDAA